MEVKQPQDVISGRYHVMHAFSLTERALYLTSLGKDDTENLFLVHAIEGKQLDDQAIQVLKKRNEDRFIPIKDVFVEDGILYHVFPIQGNILGVHLFQYAPIPMEEMKGIAKQIASHLLESYDDRQFAIVDPLNIMIEEGNRVRFIYGGPTSTLPLPGTSKDLELQEAEDVLQLAKLMYQMLTKEEADPQEINVQLLRQKISPLPIELESILMRAFSPDPYRRPRMREIWKWVHDTGTGRQEGLMGDTLTGQSSLLNFELENRSKENKADGQKLEAGNKTKKKSAINELFTTRNIILIAVISIVVLLAKNLLLGNDARSVAESIIDSNIQEDAKAAEKYYNDSIQADKNGNLQAAIQNAIKAISANPEKVEYYSKLATYYGAQKNYSKGIEVLEIAKEIFSEDDIIYDQLATFYYYQKDYPKALEVVNTAIELNSREANYYYHQGKILKALKKQNEAIQAFKMVANKDPNNAKGLHELSVYSYSLGKLDEAIQYEQQAVKIKPNEYQFLITLGTLYLKEYEQKSVELAKLPEQERDKQLREILEKAYQYFNQARNIDKNNPEAHYLVSRTKYLYGLYVDALTAATNAIHLDKSKPAIYYYQMSISAIKCHMDKNPNSQCQTSPFRPKEPYKDIAIRAAREAVQKEPSNSSYTQALRQAEQLK